MAWGRTHTHTHAYTHTYTRALKVISRNQVYGRHAPGLKIGISFTFEYISSDESGIEDGKGVIFVRDLPWRHKRVTNFFQKLEDEHNSKV